MRILCAVPALAAVAVLSSAAGPVASASADVVWLCKPGMEDNPCRDTLDTTHFTSAGESRRENPALPADPPADCFYVYPTVSEQSGSNANKDRDEALHAIARYQASRYSQACRVYAPVYRQQTLAQNAQGGSPAALGLAYSDVKEAWEEYLRKDNGGRGVVLLGHSQGSRMLRRLIREEVDPKPAVRKRMIAAVIPGANVLVRRGQLAGGDFQNVPACTSDSQVGCVMAWSTYNEDPPENSRFGRSPTEDTSRFGLPAGPDYEVMCTNPASLGANERRPLSTLTRTERYPGVIGALLLQTYGGTPPSAPTPWVEPQDHYTGRCEQRDGAHVLFLEPIGSARRLNSSPEPSWGLHITDANIGLGDSVATVQKQIPAYLKTVKPRLGVSLSYRRGASRCARGGVRLRLGGADRGQVESVLFRRGSKVLARDGGAPFKVTVARSRLRGGAVNRIEAVATLGDGRSAVRTVPVRTCR